MSSQSTSLVHINALIDKTTHYDPDERFMATSDLAQIIEQGARLDVNLEKRICQAILKQLDDTSSNVQTVAVKTLSLLVSKVQESLLQDICIKLADSLLAATTNRDIYTVGLKTCIAKIPSEFAPLIAGKLASKLVAGARDHPDATLDSLDIIADLLGRFSKVMTESHEPIIRISLEQLANPRPVLRKRAMACLGALAQVIPDASLNRVVESLLNKITAQARPDESSSIVQTIGVIGRSAGSRLGKHVERVVPLLLSNLGQPSDESRQNANGDELREKIFQGLESFVVRCPNEMAKFIDPVMKACKEFFVYDPNFNDMEDDDAGGGNDAGDMEEDGSDFSEQDLGDDDDDDSSWKVRRVAAKVLGSLLATRPGHLASFYVDFGDLLVARLKERIESVRLEVVATLTILLTCTKSAHSPQTTNLLLQRLPAIVRALSWILKDKSKKLHKSKVAALQTLTTLCSVVGGQLGPYLKGLVPLIANALEDKNMSMRLEALVLVHALLDVCPASDVLPVAEGIKKPVLKALGAEWFKIVSESLRCTQSLAKAVRPIADGMYVQTQVNVKDWASSLTAAVLPRLRANDIDQEIKVAAIECSGTLLAHFGGTDLDAGTVKDMVGVLCERMRNDSTRLPALRAVEACAKSPSQAGLGQVIASTTPDLASFLRQASRELKQQTLVTLAALLASSQSAAFEPQLLAGVMAELGKLVTDKDMYIAHLSLDLASLSLDEKGPSVAPTVVEHVLQPAIKLASSALLQAQTLKSLTRLFAALTPSVGADKLMDRLTSSVAFADLTKPAMASLAECVASIVLAADTKERDEMIAYYMGQVSNASAPLSARYMAVVTLGAVGAKTSLAGRKPPVEQLLQNVFAQQQEEMLKQAAACSLGKAAVGDTKYFVPIVMKALSSGSNQQYHLLASLREIVSSQSAGAVAHLDLELILSVLDTHCGDEDEGVRTMVAECLGRVAVLKPDEVFPRLVSVDSHSHLAKWTRITAFKFALVAAAADPSAQQRSTHALKSLFRVAVAAFLLDQDLEVCKAALISVHALLHHDAPLARQVFPGGEVLVPALLQLVQVRPELQRKVDFGPFKQLVDDGLPVRKNAYACLLVMIENCPDLLMPLAGGSLMGIVSSGLGDSPEDSPDVPFICHQIIVQLCARASPTVVASMDALVVEFSKTMDKKQEKKEGKEDKDPEKAERRMAIIRSALRALEAMSALPSAQEERNLVELAQSIAKSDVLKAAAEAEGLQALLRLGGTVLPVLSAPNSAAPSPEPGRMR